MKCLSAALPRALGALVDDLRTPRWGVCLLAQRREQKRRHVMVMLEPGLLQKGDWPFRVSQPEAQCLIQVLRRGESFVEPPQDRVVERPDQTIDDPAREIVADRRDQISSSKS